MAVIQAFIEAYMREALMGGTDMLLSVHLHAKLNLGSRTHATVGHTTSA